MIYKLLYITTMVIDSLRPKIINKPFPHQYDRDTTVNYIVLHYDAGVNPKATFSFLKRKHNSYHYYIDRNGVIYKLIDPKYEAGHAGLSLYDGHMRMNRYSIGICFQNTGKQLYTNKQYKSGGWLISQLYKRFPDARDKKLLGHSDITILRKFNKKQDPGDRFDWNLLKQQIK